MRGPCRWCGKGRDKVDHWPACQKLIKLADERPKVYTNWHEKDVPLVDNLLYGLLKVLRIAEEAGAKKADMDDAVLVAYHRTLRERREFVES